MRPGSNATSPPFAKLGDKFRDLKLGAPPSAAPAPPAPVVRERIRATGVAASVKVTFER